MSLINNLKLSKTNNKIFNSRPYKNLNKIIIGIYVLFMLVYLFRKNLYKIDNQYITLLAGTAPNLIPSFLFTLIGIFYIVPIIFNSIKPINKPMYLWLINALNIIIFLLIEYIHVVFNLGVWDNNDIIASLIGIIVSTIIYFKVRKMFVF